MLCDELAKRISDQYGLFLFALAGRYQQMRAPGIEVTPRAVLDLSKDVHALAETFNAVATVTLRAHMTALAEGASGELTELLIHRRREAEGHIRGMIAENIAQVMKMAKTGVGTFASLLSGVTGAIGLLAQRQAGTIVFKVKDSSGRHWVAKKLMYVVVRDMAYQAALDVQISEFHKNGVDKAILSNGRIISMRGSEGLPFFFMIRNSIFHPNSNLTMEPYV